jgi:hypothetical protein
MNKIKTKKKEQDERALLERANFDIPRVVNYHIDPPIYPDSRFRNPA